MVQGSKQASRGITSEQRTEPQEVGCAGMAPDTAQESAGETRNKSGTAEVNAPLSLTKEAKARFYAILALTAPMASPGGKLAEIFDF